MRNTRKKRKKHIEKEDYWKSPYRSRVLPYLKPNDQTAYYYYRRKRKTDNKIGENRSLYSKSVMAIYEAINELMTEHEGGVFLKRYGYFTGMIMPWLDNGFISKNNVTPYFHTDGYNYRLQFFPRTSRKTILNGMYMDNSFTAPLTSRFSKSLYDGFRPKLNISTLKSAYGYSKITL